LVSNRSVFYETRGIDATVLAVQQIFGDLQIGQLGHVDHLHSSANRDHGAAHRDHHPVDKATQEQGNR